MHAAEGLTTVDAYVSSLEALHQVLVHLSGPDGSRSLYNTAARGLHLASKQHQASARDTLRHLRLDRYHNGLVSAHGSTSNLAAAAPWDLLQACPRVTSWTLHPEQLASFADGLKAEVAAAASQLRRLEVKGLDCTCDAQLQGLGRLLWACSQLEEADITCADLKGCLWQPNSKPWLLLDPDSTSLATAKVPPAPLRSWVSDGIPYSLLDHWASQQQQQEQHVKQLGSTLAHLSMYNGGDAADFNSFAALTGLKELTLGDMWSAPWELPLRPRALLADKGAVEAMCALTNLQYLSVTNAAVEELPESMAALKQLTCLGFPHAALRELPEDLGVWLPGLERLEVSHCKLAAIPTSLTRLTHLDLSSHSARRMALPTTLTRLKELNVGQAGAWTMSVEHVSQLTALQLLDMSSKGASLSILQPLTRLRHLSLDGVYTRDSASYTVLAALKQLTHLNLGWDFIGQQGPNASCFSALAGTEPLPALQQLDLAHQPLYSTTALAPWVARLTALTWLNLTDCWSDYNRHPHKEMEQLQWLPTQLQELDLRYLPVDDVLQGLQQLQSLQVLHLTAHCCVRQLPAWLSQLRCLEVLDLISTGVSTEQQVLAAMPALRCVRVKPSCASVVYGAAAHLHFGHSNRLKAYP